MKTPSSSLQVWASRRPREHPFSLCARPPVLGRWEWDRVSHPVDPGGLEAWSRSRIISVFLAAWNKGHPTGNEHQQVTSLGAQTVKRLPTMRETRVPSLGQEDPLEKEIAAHPRTLAWHGWRSLVDCSPWGRRESDTMEQLHFLFHTRKWSPCHPQRFTAYL